MNPVATSMYRWYGDGGFYKTPGLKALLVGVSASSLAYRLLATQAPPRWLLWSVRMWACPSAGVWLVAVLIFISCRPLERQLGAAKFAKQLLSSALGGVALAASIYVGSSYHGNSLLLPSGALLHVVVGSLAWLHFSSVFPLHGYRPLPFLSLSSNGILYLLAGLFGSSSGPTALLAVCGVVGAAMQSQFGPLPLPSPPSWLAAGISTLLETEAPPPSQLSGATLEVQRQQHMDRLEQMMASFHQNRQRFTLHSRLRRRPAPSEQHIAQLVAMGFPRSEAQQALVAMGNDIAAAIQLLTSRHHPNS